MRKNAAPPSLETSDQTYIQSPLQNETQQLHVCSFGCGCEMVYPITQFETSATHWLVELCCPNCERSDYTLANDEQVEDYEKMLNAGDVAIKASIRKARQAQLVTETVAFAVETIKAGNQDIRDFMQPPPLQSPQPYWLGDK